MTDEQRAELKRLAEAYSRNNQRRGAEGMPPALVWVDPAAVLDLLREHEEDQGVIRVWRGRCERAESERDALKAEVIALRASIQKACGDIERGIMAVTLVENLRSALRGDT